MRNVKSKILVLTIGIVVSFLIAEISLRVFGAVYFYLTKTNKACPQKSGEFTVLCIGDSFTLGTGADAGEDYPTQLEKLLSEKFPQNKIKIINQGLGASNSAMTVQRLGKNIYEIQPDLVIVLTGGGNAWNAYGYGDERYDRPFLAWLNDQMYKIKLFKLAKLLFYNYCSKRSLLLSEYIKEHDFRSRTSIPPETQSWFSQGGFFEKEGKYNEAIFWYKKTIEHYPTLPLGYERLLNLYLRKGDERGVEQTLKKLIELNPKRLKYYLGFYRFLNDPIGGQENRRFIKKYAKMNPFIEDITKSLDEPRQYKQRVADWIKRDLKKMLILVKEKGTEVIFQNYPNYWGPSHGNYAIVNAVLREFAKENAVLFLDNEKAFEEIFLRGESKEEYFAFDKCHCNRKGYGFMAANLLAIIEANALFGAIETGDHARNKF